MSSGEVKPERLEVVEAVDQLARVCRERGIRRVSIKTLEDDTIEIEMGDAPLELTPTSPPIDESASADDRTTAHERKREKYRRILGRVPSDEELARLP